MYSKSFTITLVPKKVAFYCFYGFFFKMRDNRGRVNSALLPVLTVRYIFLQ